MNLDDINQANNVAALSMQGKLRHYFDRQGPADPAPLVHMREDQAHGKDKLIAYREAAVLVPVHINPLGSSIVLTLRTAHLSSHAGQVSFPGGTKEDSDRSPIDTALRESEEEIGLTAGDVEILGKLGSFFMPSGYRITPVVGIIRNTNQLQACPHEVAQIIHLPLHIALNPDSYESVAFTRDGITHQVWELYTEEHRVWGATASILRHLAEEMSLINLTLEK